MKKILFLVKEQNTNKIKMLDELKAYLVDQKIDLQMALISEVEIKITQGLVSVSVEGKELKDYDLVYFRRVGSEFFWLASAISAYLRFNRVPFIDSVMALATGNKLASYVKLALSNLPVIPTVFLPRSKILSGFARLSGELGLPFVVKELRSQKGKGVCLIKNQADLQNFLKLFPEGNFMFQKFIKCKEEYRVLVLENQIGAFEKKTSTTPGEFRNNVSLGASEEFYDVKTIPTYLKQTTIKAAKVNLLEIAGVDVLLDENSKSYLLEVNRGPGFTYGCSASPETKNLALYLKRKLYSLDVKSFWRVFFQRT